MTRLVVLIVVALAGVASGATAPTKMDTRAEQVQDAGGTQPTGTAGIRGVVQTADSVPPAFLSQLLPSSVPVAVGDGARTVRDLRIER